MQLTSAFATLPSVVGALNVHETVSTVVPAGCSTVIVRLVNAMSVITSVHRGFGQSGAPGIGVTGAFVVTVNGVLPFLISLSGIATLPVTSTGAGFWPGASQVFVPGFPQVAVGFAQAARVTSTSPLPSPASSPAPASVKPLSVNAGSA